MARPLTGGPFLTWVLQHRGYWEPSQPKRVRDLVTCDMGNMKPDEGLQPSQPVLDKASRTISQIFVAERKPEVLLAILAGVQGTSATTSHTHTHAHPLALHGSDLHLVSASGA